MATTRVSTFPGVSVSIVPRQKKRSAPHCPACKSPIRNWPQCGHDMRGTEEKGVDVHIATDMIKLAWADDYDTAVLVSADKDSFRSSSSSRSAASRSSRPASHPKPPISPTPAGAASTYRATAERSA